MYIEIHNYQELEQKALYFKMNNALNMDEPTELNIKFCGIYAIYKDDLCLYVGQSTNLASRIATHIRGKYEDFTKIYMWNVEDIGFSDYQDRDTDNQKTILDNCEKFLMTKLKPIENIAIDMDFKLSKNKTPDIFEQHLTYVNNDNGEVIEKEDGEVAHSSFIVKKINRFNLCIADDLPALFDGIANYIVSIHEDKEKSHRESFNTFVRLHTGELHDEFKQLRINYEA